MRKELLASIRARSEQAIETGDFWSVLAPEAKTEASALLSAVIGPAVNPDEPPDLEAWLAVGEFHLQRARALPEGRRDHDLQMAMIVFQGVYESDPDAVPEPLRKLYADETPRKGRSRPRRKKPDLDPVALTDQGGELFDWYRQTGDLEAVQAAVRVFRAVLDVVTKSHPMWGLCLSNLWIAVSALAEETADVDTQLESVSLGRTLLEVLGKDDPDYAEYAGEIGLTLRSLFEATGDVDSLREAVRLARAAVEATPKGDAYLPGRLSNLGAGLHMLYEQTGDAQALHTAVRAGRAAVAALPDDDPDLASCLSNLGNSLRVSFNQTGDLATLREAVTVGRTAVEITEDDDPEQAGNLSNLGSSLLALYEHTEDYEALAEAVDVGRAAAEAIPAGHPDQQIALTNLGVSLRLMAEHIGDPDLLHEAAAAHRQVLAATPDSHPSRAGRLSNLGNTLRSLYESTGDPKTLHEATAASRNALAALPANHPSHARYQSNLETGLSMLSGDLETEPTDGASNTRKNRLAQVRSRIDRFIATQAAEVVASDAIGEVVDLLCSVPDPVEDVAVAQAAGWLLCIRVVARVTTDDTAETAVALDLLASAYRSGDDVPDVIREQFDRSPPAEPDGAAVLAKLGRLQLREVLKNKDDEAALNRAVDLLRRAVALAGSDHRDYARCLDNLASALRLRFKRAGLPADLEEAIKLSQTAVEATGPDEPARASCLTNLSSGLLARFEHLASEADLDAAIEAGQAAVTGWPDQPEHAGMVSNLDRALRARAAFRDQTADLDRMIELARNGERLHIDRSKVVVLTKSSTPDRPGAAQLSDLLLGRFERAGDPADLDDAIQVRRDAVAAAVEDSGRAGHLSGLGDLLRLRFIHFGQGQDLTDAVAYGRAAVTATPVGDPELGGRQSNLANALSRRYRSTGRLDDLENAVALGRSAVATTSHDELNHPIYLANLCSSLRMLFEHTGRIADLDEAVDAGRAAVDAAVQHAPHLSVFLGNLGAALLVRFRHLGSQADLEESLDALRRAALAAPAASPDRALVLANLGGALQMRFASARRPEDLDEAIDVSREAVRATPLEHSGRAARLSNLAASLGARFGISGDPSDLDEAVEASRSAVKALPAGHPERATSLSNYALVLRNRHEHTGRLADLDAAVDAAHAAVAEAAADHPDRTVCLINLGQALRDRHARTRTDADLDGALAAAREAASAETGPPRVRAVAATLWGAAAAMGGRWADAVAGHAAAVDLVARTVPRHLTRRDQEFLLDDAGGIGSDAAACCVRAGSVTRAVELFEQGRGLLLSQALDSRTDLTELAERHPEPSERLTALCAELDRPGSADAGGVVARRATAAAFDRLVADIRELPGFDRFLRAPSARDLAPDQGHAVIVSVSRFGSYALILPAGGEVTAVPLPMLTPDTVLAEVKDFIRAVGDTAAHSARIRAAGQDRMARTLGWLWDAVAGPVLDRLRITGPPREREPWPRLWWCPSGLLSFLPLHAAGHHDTASHAVPLTVLDRVICSTTPTLRALAHSRRGADPARPRADRAVVVAMPKTPGSGADLPGAEAEAALLCRAFPGNVEVLTGTAATHDAVLAALRRARWAHFACHGHNDLFDPSAGRLLLADHHNRPLTVADLVRLRMDDSELAFLSACSTARPGGRLADEVIHLAAAFQLAGYRHVIGTLWPIGDQHAVDVADLVYGAITRGVDISAAVHGAARRMRDRWPGEPSVWASHIHVGA